MEANSISCIRQQWARLALPLLPFQKSNANEAFTRQSVMTVLNELTFEDFEKYVAPKGRERTTIIRSISFRHYKPVLDGQCSCSISALHGSVYVAGEQTLGFDFHTTSFSSGRYNKYSRTLSQTPWVIDGIRKAETSVEELIALPISKLIVAKGRVSPPCVTPSQLSFLLEHAFLSSGREDVDVRTLGIGTRRSYARLSAADR